MYTNFIYFVLVLIVFASQQPLTPPRFSVAATALGSLGFLCCFALINHWVFQRLARRISSIAAGSRKSVLYHKVVSRQSVLAFAFFCMHTYLLDLKSHLLSLPGFSQSFTLQGLVAISLFLFYLAIVWAGSHQASFRLSSVGYRRSTVVWANLKFNFAILLPWLLISGSFDVVRVLPFEFLHQSLESPLGQLFFFSGLLVVFLLFAPPLVLKLWGCRSMPPGKTRTFIEDFCRQHDLKLKDIFIWPTHGTGMITAGIMGLHWRCRYLLITEPLLEILSLEELQAVLSHEMGHVKEHHLAYYILFLLGYLVLSYAVFDFSFLLMLATALPASFPRMAVSSNSLLPSLILTLPLLLLLVVYFRYLFGFFIRNFERQADLYVFTTMGVSLPLISALEKIGLYSGNVREVPSWHHFSIKQRVDYLLTAEEKPWLRQRHRRKLQSALALYLIALITTGAGGYLLHSGKIGSALNDRLLIRILSRQVKEQPEEAELHLALGTLYYQRHDLKAAVKELQTALALDPHNPETLNNLAWLLATSREDPFFQPQRALELAQKAAELSPQPHILDTLAEAYAANHRFEEALATAERALAAVPVSERSYYVKQVAKFRQKLHTVEKE
ncbi:MAG: M48 family metalloprotease [Deltaproteobacteria bacterium]|nr:M48 family metalloprotease [Deltaproteobacteria bacterium]MBW2071040.1 M48 family metalloprotease [Deltaproteobacteria bacterium]